MQTQDLDRETAALFAAADAALDAGDFREGARLLWEAARVNIAALARSRGWPCDTRDDLKQAIFKLDKGPYGKGRVYSNQHYVLFAAANILREHAEEYDLLAGSEFEWTDVEDFRLAEGAVKRFIKLLKKQNHKDGVTA